MISILNRYKWKHADEIAHGVVNRLRLLPQPVIKRYRMLYFVAIWLILSCVLLLSCFFFHCSPTVAASAAGSAFFLDYRSSNRVYRLMKRYYEEALEADGESMECLKPSRKDKIIYSLLLACWLSFLVAFAVFAIGIHHDSLDLMFGVCEAFGSRSSPEQAAVQEQRLRKRPNDPEAHARLSGYYMARYLEGCLPEDAASLRVHSLWLIEHYPGVLLVGVSNVAFSPKRNGGDTEPLLEAEGLWLEQIDRHPKDTRVLANAADFFCYAADDLPQAIDLMKRCVALDAGNDAWLTQLSAYHARERRKESNPGQ